MSFKFRKRLSVGGTSIVKDFTLDTTYAATAVAGDPVMLDASGKVILATTTGTAILGVLEGFNWVVPGNTPTIAKVRIDPQAIYEASFVGAGALTPGVAYGLDDKGNVDTADTTVKIVKIVEVVDDKPYVVITARQLV